MPSSRSGRRSAKMVGRAAAQELKLFGEDAHVLPEHDRDATTRAIIEIAREGRLSDFEAVADKLQLPVAQIRRLVADLVRTGLLTVVQGMYRPAAPPSGARPERPPFASVAVMNERGWPARVARCQRTFGVTLTDPQLRVVGTLISGRWMARWRLRERSGTDVECWESLQAIGIVEIERTRVALTKQACSALHVRID